MELSPYLYATLGGVFPALIWLLFFLKEDKRNPEPRHLIFFTFIAGAISVLFVLPAEKFAYGLISGGWLILVWACIEELAKYAAAFFVVLWRKEVDEPLDPLIYMVTVALGFAAFENILFMLGPFMDGNVPEALITGNMRFLGAALLHTLSSAMVGGALALSYYRKEKYKRLYLFTGLVLSVLLHTLFNFSIMNSQGGEILITFSVVWFGVIVLFLLFEKVKRIRKPPLLTTNR